MHTLPDINKCKIAVLGLGYVGLPVLNVFANQKISLLNKKSLELSLIGFDIINLKSADIYLTQSGVLKSRFSSCASSLVKV